MLAPFANEDEMEIGQTGYQLSPGAYRYVLSLVKSDVGDIDEKHRREFDG